LASQARIKLDKKEKRLTIYLMFYREIEEYYWHIIMKVLIVLI